MIRHIFCDLDGTLYNNGISDEDIKAIEEIEKEGVIFHVATGRVFKQAYNMLNEKIKLNGYFICENGSFIFDKYKNLIFKEPIDDYLVRKIISRFESDLAYLYLKYNGDIILSGGEEVFSNYTKDYILDEEMFKKENFDNLVGNVGIVSNNMDELKRLEYYYKNEFSEVCDIYLSGPYTLNIVPNHVSKRHGIEHICEKYNINLNEVATMGDSPNDICMLKDIKYSFAMDKSNKDVKESASYIVNSVRDGIEKIKKINRTK
ncbi:Cof-type HAD-IIB family hydrolase [Terrisporobacter mayombei]|uniref:5-amino-6-(5-phospho-D-ribitylamino)uracil phosphatase YcsE n=1 Tax=Terrisporobacter mayombei TaxID=1541 RepID=A0ABY9Q061_9FIRM|nr:Cof-type HAD-IIB family hydrolase [Terrisporobacter mayombei]MCC3867076.1 HAD family hydrolase [Terrisporobacter mayombei]WMT81336.1 5-amino-6-(5-phospho-D-ribitylamino)uracil phosphatase YcsE [Terrisporobacter mayombei]